ncbi:hypothetical protein NL676_007932 [Syzygium grande]|nr:hypothetical protein NL676_007932 [Syzygium grande]
MAKRASASSSSGQPSQPKRPCLAPRGQIWNGSERNLVPGSCSTEEEDVQRVCEEELERAKSHSVEYCQSTGNALKDIVQLIHSVEKRMHSMEKRMHSIENSIQELKEAVELAISHSPHVGRANPKSTAKNDARNLQLQVRTKLSLSIFTGKKLEGKGGTRISVALIDANTGAVITSGPESSIKLDIVVLEGDFNKEDEDNWAQEEFEKYMVKEREGKGPLLTGNLLLTLKEGVGVLGELTFTDNSSWTRSKRFRIGLKVASGYCENTQIQEGITNAFRVKEHRGELSEKHHPPASDDAVWRLETIAKDGKYHQKLSKVGINTVEDFLLQLFTDSEKLRGFLGESLKSKNWDILVHHAKTCKTDWKLCWYYSDEMEKHGAVFNIDGQLIGRDKTRGILCYSSTFCTREVFFFQEHGDTIVKKAFDNWNDVREFSGETFSGSMQNKSSSSFPSRVLQIENLTPVQRNLVPRVCATPGGLEAPPGNVGYTAEGHNGATALALLGQSQNTGDDMEFSLEDILRLAEHQPIFTDSLNGLISPVDNGTSTVGLPQSCDTNLQGAMCSRMIDSSSQMHTGNEIVLSSEPSSYASISSFQSSSTLPLPQANHVMEDFQSTYSDDISNDWFAGNQHCDGTFFQIPRSGDGSIRGHNGATAVALPVQLQNTNSGNAMKLSVDESVRLAALQPISTNRLNVLIPQGDNGIPTVRLPIQSHGNNFQCAMRSHMIHSPSQMDYTVNENVPPSEPPSAAISISQSSSTLPPPKGNHVMEDLEPTVSEDSLDYLLAFLSQSPPHDDECSHYMMVVLLEVPAKVLMAGSR